MNSTKKRLILVLGIIASLRSALWRLEHLSGAGRRGPEAQFLCRTSSICVRCA